MQCTIDRVASPPDIEAVRELFVEYNAWLGDLICSHRLAEEIATLPGPYAAPAGVLLLALRDGMEPVGCVGVRPHQGHTAEMKRLYVRPACRGAGLGRRLAERAISEAASLGYRRLVLTTIPAAMGTAVRLYESLGFRPTGPFHDFSHVHDGAGMRYLELDLAAWAASRQSDVAAASARRRTRRTLG